MRAQQHPVDGGAQQLAVRRYEHWRTESLVSFYAGAPSAVERIAPADVQARRIGHFGFFREQFSQSLWPGMVDKLHRLAALAAPAAPAAVQHANVPHTTA